MDEKWVDGSGPQFEKIGKMALYIVKEETTKNRAFLSNHKFSFRLRRAKKVT